MDIVGAMLKGKLFGLKGDALKGYIAGGQLDSTYKSSVAVFDFDGDREAYAYGLRLAGVGEVSFRKPYTYNGVALPPLPHERGAV